LTLEGMCCQIALVTTAQCTRTCAGRKCTSVRRPAAQDE
jgi:hypothetical protein